MTEHKQVPIEICGTTTNVDKGIEDIIECLNNWGFHTSNSCKDNFGDVWIEFISYIDLRRLMQLALKHNSMVNAGFVHGGPSKWKETLFSYLEENGDFTFMFSEACIPDPNDSKFVIGIGEIEDFFSLRFPKRDLKKFKKLLFESLNSHQ